MTKTFTTDDELVAEWANVVFTCGFLLVLGSTLFPFDFSFEETASRSEYSSNLNLMDLLANVLLFLPFGFGFTCVMQKRKPRGIVTLIVIVAASSGLSFTVEALQVFLPSRIPSLTDIVTNSIGGCLGFVCFRLWRVKILSYASTLVEKSKAWLSIKNLAAGFIGYVTLAFLISVSLPSATNLSNWDPTFPLLLGNERTGDRPWRGYVSEVLIADRVMDESEVARTFSNQRFFAAIGDSLLASYRLTGKGSYPDRTGQLRDLSWRGEPPDAQDGTGVFLTPSSWLETTPAAFMTQKIRETSQFTLSTTVATADTTQTGPARIVSLSSDSHYRNFTLGQQGTHLVFRLRTPLTGENGANPELVVPDIFADTNPHHLVITYSAPVLRLYVDGLQNSHSFELAPGVALFRYLLPSRLREFSTNCYNILYYTVIFIPLGSLLALINIIVRGRFVFHILLGGGVLLPSLMLEGILATGSGRAMKLENLLLSMALTVGVMILVKVRAVSRLQSNVVN